MMLDEQVVQGKNYTCFHAGPKDDWTRFRLDRPDVPMPARGKLFLRELLNSNGLEISLNSAPPGKSMPFLHRHRANEEIFIVIGGRGQFLVDGECIDVQEGSFLRLTPPAARAWRNNSDAPFYFLCVQYRADSEVQSGTADGEGVEGSPVWPT